MSKNWFTEEFMRDAVAQVVDQGMRSARLRAKRN